MIRKALFPCLSSVIIVTGCAMGWTRPNTTETEYQQDLFACKKEVAIMYPVSMAAPSSETNCQKNGNQVNCTTTPTQQTDVNEHARSSAGITCMRAKGYIFKFGR